MPGIFGFIFKEKHDTNVSDALIKNMRDSLAHFDYYVADVFANGAIGLGNIGIPVKAETRFHVDNEKKQVAAFSGYIYGWHKPGSFFQRPTNDKAQRLLEIYNAEKENIAPSIDGSFNVCVADFGKSELLICNDRLGHRQLYYYEDDQIFLFSTEYKAFFAYDGFNKSLNNTAVSDYFNFSYVLGDKTFLKNVKIFRGGHVLKISQNGTNIRKYWDFNYDNISKQSLQELIEEADSIYRPQIRKQIGNNKTIILPLSGGLDSRFILAHALDAGVMPRTFTHGKSNCLDHKIAKMLAGKCGVESYEFVELNPMWAIEYAEQFVKLSEGMTEASPAILYGVSSQYNSSPESTLFLNGIFGGPSNFGGPYYRDYDIVDNIEFKDKLSNIARSLFGESLTDEYYSMFSPDFGAIIKANHMKSLEDELPRYMDINGFHNQKDIFFIRNRLVRYMNQVDCNRFIWHDHFALYDDKLVDFYMKLPPEFKLNRRFFIEYFKAKYPKLAEIPYQATGVNLYEKPSELKNKIKTKVNKAKYYLERLSGGRLRFYNMDYYHHYNQWYRANRKFREYYENILLDDRTISRGFFNKTTIEALLKRQKAGGNSYYEISTLASFELYNRLFIDQ